MGEEVPKKRKRSRRLTPKQRRLIEFVTSHPNATQEEIATAVGYCAQSAVSATLSKSNVQQKMAEALDKDPNLCDKVLLQKLKEGLEAQSVSRSFDRNGNLTGTFKDADFHARKSYLTLIGKWKGLEVIKQELSGPNGGPIELETIQALKSVTKTELLKIIAAAEAPK